MLIFESIRKTLKIKWERACFVSEYPSVQKLVDHLWLRKTASKRSVLAYCWILTNFCLWAKSSKWVSKEFPLKAHFSPEDFLAWTREDLELVVQQYLDEMRQRSLQRGPSTRYVNTALACLKTYFRVNGFCRETNSELQLKNYRQPARTKNRAQCVPTVGEVCKMAERAGNTRNRAIILTLFSTGLRNTSLRALRIKDVIKEIETGTENLLIKVEPEWNKRLPGSCKGSIPYYTFTSAQASKGIRAMLNRRKEMFHSISDNERSINDNEPLFISGGSVRSKKSPLSDRELQEIIKKAAKEAEIDDWKHVTPHSLRKVFEGILRSPLIDGTGMDTKDQEWLMGHILPGSQESYYDYTKINKLRSQFAKLNFEDRKTQEIQSLNARKNVARILEIDSDLVKVKRERELGRALQVSEEIELLENAIKAKISFHQDEREQKPINKDELQSYLTNGWKFIGVIDEHTAIVERFRANTDAINHRISALFVENQSENHT